MFLYVRNLGETARFLRRAVRSCGARYFLSSGTLPDIFQNNTLLTVNNIKMETG